MRQSLPLEVSNKDKTSLFDTLYGMPLKVAPSELSDWLIGRGRHFISTAEIATMYGISAASVPSSLKRAREAGKLISVTKGGWVPVPPEYRSAGAPPPSHFIDPLMKHVGHAYYVGFLSAAALHGASHQSPMAFQVATTAKLRERRIGRGRRRFIQRDAVADRARIRLNVPTGRIWVSSPEVTVLDLVESPRQGGGLYNVANVVGELLENGRLGTNALSLAAAAYPTVVAQRTGYLLDFMSRAVETTFDTEPLRQTIDDARYRELSPGAGDGDRDDRWHVIVNAEIEHDL